MFDVKAGPGGVTRAIRRIFGLDFPAPVVGQLWRSDFSGNTIEVTRAEVLDDGVVFVEAREYRASGRPAMADFFCCGIASWRHRLRAEQRVLIGIKGAPSITAEGQGA